MEKSKRKIRNIVATVALLIFIVTGLTVYLKFGDVIGLLLQESKPKTEQNQAAEKPKKEEKFFKKPVNVLVLGIDQRGKEKSRTDTMMVYRIDPIKNEVKLFSIPRDTYVNIPGRGMDKINHAHAFGGVPLATQSVEEFLGIKIDHYVVTNFVGFKELIDLVGGVTIDVEKNINRGGVTIEKGEQHLNSEQALIYVRDRWDPMGDIERVKRQQKFIKALVKEVSGFEPKWKLVSVVPDIYSNIETDIPMKAGKEIISMVNGVDMENSEIERVPGWFYNKNGISYWKPDLDQTSEIVAKIFKDDVPTSVEEPNKATN